MILGIHSKSWQPLISTLSPHAIETLRSCRIDPNPLLTLLVSLNSPPKAIAVSFACSGVIISRSVAIYTKGIPNLSKFQVTISPSSVNSEESFLALSSSRQITEIPTSPVFVIKFPCVWD